MNIETLRDQLPAFAKDTKLNLGIVLTPEGSPDLSQNQIYGVALSSAYSVGNKQLIEAILEDGANVLSEQEIEAAKAAATIMAMNNIYYRFTYMARDKEYGKMPAKLRMGVIGTPGIEKVDFELYSLAISIINGCGMCVDAHVIEVEKAGISKLGVQSVARIAAVINATGKALTI
jgi:alkyl hydroperoxide reductase subunit D